MVIAVYPGTFDPLTRGHEDLVRRSSGLFDELIVGVADSRTKKPFFTMEERMAIAKEVLGHYPNVRVESFTGLLKDFVREHNASVIIRGLRAVSDFEYEFQMALANRKLYAGAETVFLTTTTENMYLSSSVVKQIAAFGGDISHFVPPEILDFIEKRLVKERQS